MVKVKNKRNVKIFTIKKSNLKLSLVLPQQCLFLNKTICRLLSFDSPCGFLDDIKKNDFTE